MHLLTPYTIHEADLALYPAWRDGLPFTGPGPGRFAPAPVFLAKAGLTIAETRRRSAPSAHNWTAAEPNIDAEYEITIAFPEGAFSDSLSRIPSRIAIGGFHILVVRFLDSLTGQWSCLRFFYVTIETDETSVAGEVMARSMRLKSTWLQEFTGTNSPPAMEPLVFGEVDWLCGTQRITCLTYDPVAELWASLPANETGDSDTLYINFGPVTETPTDVALAAYFPRVFPGDEATPALPQAKVVWSNLILARLGNHESAYHHGLVLARGITLQALGIPEPLLADPQSRMLDEPVVVFRFLRRVYAVIGHGVLAVPALTSDGTVPITHDPPFRLAIPGNANPTTAQSGLTLYPDGAWLDGSLKA